MLLILSLFLGDCIGLLSSSSNSPADQHMSSPTDPCDDYNAHDAFHHAASGAAGGDEMNWDDVDASPVDTTHCCNYYFKVTSVMLNNGDVSAADNSQVRCCKILADNRMTLERLKKNLEELVRVPSEYFKIFRQYPNTDDEWSCLTDTLTDASIKDGER